MLQALILVFVYFLSFTVASEVPITFSPSKFQKFQVVSLTGLSNEAYNGKIGIISEEINSDNRYGVMLFEEDESKDRLTQTVSIRSENIIYATYAPFERKSQEEFDRDVEVFITPLLSAGTALHIFEPTDFPSRFHDEHIKSESAREDINRIMERMFSRLQSGHLLSTSKNIHNIRCTGAYIFSKYRSFGLDFALKYNPSVVDEIKFAWTEIKPSGYNLYNN